MNLDRIYTPELAQVAYLVADSGVAAVIDPRRDVQVYLDWAAEHGVEIVAVLETHVHADFVSGGKHLAELTGARLYTPRLGGVTYDHVPLDHGTKIPVGDAVLEAFHTPGHTPEHMSFLLYAPGEEQPSALYSGDALFVGDVGRPDLLGADATRGLASQLFHTVQERFKNLADDVVVYPGHTAGSSCGKRIGDDPSTTIGREKAENYAFQHNEEQAFVDAVLADMPTPPTYYPQLKKYNRTAIAPWDEDMALPQLEVAEVKAAVANGALIVDMRSKEDFSKGFLKDSVFAGLDGDFQTWMGWHAPYDRDLILMLPAGADVNYVRTALGQIGFDQIAGVFFGQPAELGETIAIETISNTDVGQQLDAGVPLLDVRSTAERAELALKDSISLPAGDIVQGRMVDELGKDDSFLVSCAAGYRSTVVSGLLRNRGYENVISIIDGFEGELANRAATGR